MATDPFPRNRRTDAFERRVARALAGAELAEDARVVVAASGGPDSTAALIAVARSLGAERVAAAHFDHRLRPAAEAARERALVEEVARRLGVTVVAGRAPRRPEDGAEETARVARYAWLATAARRAGASTCVTGHTRDDQAETVLLRLARGASAGAAGIASVAPWPVPGRGAGGLCVVRPLLRITRAEVEAYLDAIGVEAAHDPSNDSTAYARNRVRQQVMPALRTVNAQAVDHLAGFAERQREDEEFLARAAQEWISAHVRLDGAGAEIDRRALRELHPAVARRVVWLVAAGIGVPLESAHVDSIITSARRAGVSVDLPLARSVTEGMILRLRLRPRRPVAD